MSKLATASINTLSSHTMQADFVPHSDDPVLEIPLSELQALLDEMVLTHNQIAEAIRDTSILRGKELARLTSKVSDSLKAAQFPIEKLLLINASIRRLFAKVRDSLKSRPIESEKIIHVCSKIAARAIQIVDYIKTIVQDDPKRKEIALDSQQARILFSGASKEKVSRKETIRAMRRAEALWPSLQCGHRPNDGRQIMRITASVDELQDSPVMAYRDLWQRSDRNVSLSL